MENYNTFGQENNFDDLFEKKTPLKKPNNNVAEGEGGAKDQYKNVDVESMNSSFNIIRLNNSISSHDDDVFINRLGKKGGDENKEDDDGSDFVRLNKEMDIHTEEYWDDNIS